MSLPYNAISTLLDSTNAIAVVTVPSPDCYRCHEFEVFISATAEVVVEASIGGTVWVPVKVVRGSARFEVEGIHPHLRVSWTDNTGRVHVAVVQHDDQLIG